MNLLIWDVQAMSNATIKDIAKETGVSIATVSRVLRNRGYASQEVKDKVFAAAKKLNYQPNAVARSLKNHRTNTIGIIIPDISNPYFMKISKGIEDTIRENGYHLLFVSGDEDGNKEREMLNVLYEKRVDALVLATSGGNDEFIIQLNKTGTPIILIDRKLTGDFKGLDLVVEDNVGAANQITKYLLSQGHTRIGVVNGPIKVSSGLERYQGYQMALQEHGLEEDSNLVFNGNFNEEDGVKAVNKFLSLREKPTAILSFNNRMTFGVLLQLQRRGYSVPEDIVVASYGEVEAAQLLTSPGIISILQDPYEMGVRTGQIILNRLVENDKSDPVIEVLKPNLIITN